MSDWNAETADWYAENFGEYATNRLGVDALALADDACVVDVGCGTGAALRHASKRDLKGKLIGVDPVPRMVEIARERLAGHAAADRIEFKVGSAEEIPVEDSCADVVLAFDSFDHWQDQARGLAEIKRILRPKGRLAMIKDGGVPGGAASRQAHARHLTDAQFTIEEEKSIREGDVKFTLWICSPSP
jgi:ubiquinone/menaquinone biosynthesis C-methylase UbiE